MSRYGKNPRRYNGDAGGRDIDISTHITREAEAASLITKVKPLLPGAQIEYRHLAGDNIPPNSFTVRVMNKTGAQVKTALQEALVAGFVEADGTLVSRVGHQKAVAFLPAEALLALANKSDTLNDAITQAWQKRIPHGQGRRI